MNESTKGAWIISHCNKLQKVTNAPQYENIDFAGKCGIVLNALSASSEIKVSREKAKAIAKANGINSITELPTILSTLQSQRLLDQTESEILLLGTTQSSTLSTTCKIFNELDPSNIEAASLEIAEKASERPINDSVAKEYISDIFSLNNRESENLLLNSYNIGFIDKETRGKDALYFNGNIFRREFVKKTEALLHSLTPTEERLLKEHSLKLRKEGCISEEESIKLLGAQLYKKLVSVGFIDTNGISNSSGNHKFVTSPSAFCKFSDSMVDDAFDLAKAFVTSLTFGIRYRNHSSGRINQFDALIRKLINGHWVGPATAIGQDYKILEMKGVLEVKPNPNGLFSMKLLKKEVGILAQKVINEGEASTSSLLAMPSSPADSYIGPEPNREILRKQNFNIPSGDLYSLINDIRTGGI